MQLEDLKLKTVNVKISKLHAYENNAKIHTAKQIEHIANSIRDFGFNDPVGVWTNEDGEIEIVTGHGAVEAAKSLGMEEVPCNFLDHLTDEARRAYCHVHNQTQLETGFDTGALIADMDNLNCDWDNYGFEAYCYNEEIEVEEDEVPEVVECRCKPGDIWELGGHRVMCGSATSAEDMTRLCGGGVADLLITDPPYNVALGHHNRPSEAKQLHRRTDGLVIENDAWDSDDEFIEFLAQAFSNAKESMREGAAFYIWHASNTVASFIEACKRVGFTIRQTIIWNKSTFALGRQDYQWKHEPCLYGWKDGAAHYFINNRKKSTVEEIAIPDLDETCKEDLVKICKQLLSQAELSPSSVIDEDKPSRSVEHPTMKPVKLIARQIHNSTLPGDLVLDIFGGSGSTLIACEQLGRKCYTMEIDPHYCDVILTRWEDATGKKAVKVNEQAA